MAGRSLRWVPDYINASTNTSYAAGVGGTTREIFQGGVAGVANQFVTRVSFQLNFANYTSVTVKAQVLVSTSGSWQDISGATTSSDGDIVTFATMGTAGPYQQWRLHTTASDSGSPDSLDVSVIEEMVS